MSIENKERLIQSKELHYSEVIHKETAPSEQYSNLFVQIAEQYKARLARETMSLAKKICKKRSGNITILSLARAGTPIGVLLQRALTKILKRDSTHYSVSIIRDRGIDDVALDYVLQHGHEPESFVFVDGWTAKGTISNELRKSIKKYNESRKVKIADELFVISDIGGIADVQATFDDYAIPNALMNSTVSGLVSRSILNDQIGEEDFHGCVEYHHLSGYDRSNWFVDIVTAEMSVSNLPPHCTESKLLRRQASKNFLDFVMKEFGITDVNRVKPGIAEATRVLLRRVTDQLLVKRLDDPNINHLKCLAFEKNVLVTEVSDMPFGACALIKDVPELKA